MHLAAIRIDPRLADWFEEILVAVLKEHNVGQRQEAGQLRRRKEQVEGKRLKADEAYVEGRIEADSYARLKAKYSEELAEVAQGLERCRLGDVRFSPR